MYAAHKKDINRNKSFHPMTFKNLSKVESKLEASEEQEKQRAGRKVLLQREADERRYEELLTSDGNNKADGDDGDERSAKYRRVEWMGFSREPNDDGEGDNAVDANEKKTDRTAEMPGPQKESAPSAATAVTGAVTSSDAAALRKQADDDRKMRLDPLAKVLAQEDEYVAQCAKAQMHASPATVAASSSSASKTANQTGPSSTTAADNQKKIQSAIQQLLAMKKKL